MPPRSQRSRACAQCRERRVKCDETPKECGQCRRLELVCTGPLTGSIVIDMTERIVKPRDRKKKMASRESLAVRSRTASEALVVISPVEVEAECMQKSSAVDMPVLNPVLVDRRYSPDVEKAIVAIRYQYNPPRFHQPTKIMPEALDTAFLSHYVELNKGTRTYAPEIQWLKHLPRIHANATKPAVRLSLRAVSMAFYGKLHRDPSILMDSWRWYSSSLNAQRTAISCLKGSTIPTEEEVLVPLILAIYEVYVGATPSGSMAHLNAAAEIMNLRGPHNAASGAIWPLFKGIRNSDAHKCIIFNKPSVYSSPEWMTIPFENMPRDAHQSLADIELMIPHCLTLLQTQGTLRMAFEAPIAPHVDVEPCRMLTRRLLFNLDCWAATYPNLTSTTGDAAHAAPSGAGLEAAMEETVSLGSSDTFIALIASNHTSTRLILNMLMHKMETHEISASVEYSPIQSIYLDRAKICAEAILKGAAEIEKAQTPGFDLLRSIAPVMSILCTAPSPGLRDSAKEFVHRWGSKIGGLGSILQRV